MNFVVFTFVIVFGVILATYWVLLIRSEDEAQRQLRRRLKGGSAREKARSDVLKATTSPHAVPILDSVVERMSLVNRPLARLIQQSAIDITPGGFLLLTALIGLVVFFLAYQMTPWSAVAVIAGVIASTIPLMYLKWKRSSRLNKFEEQFPDSIDLIARALRAGHAFTTGLGMVSEEVPDPVGSEFKLLYEHQNFGLPLPDALKRFAERVPLLDARFFVTAVLTQREAGGNLSEVLDNLSAVIRDRFKVKRQVRVLSAHGRITGWVLTALPPVMAVVFFTIIPDTMRLLIDDPLGVKMVIAAVLMQVTGALVIRKLVNIEY
jgi:tight adherence protein B